MGIDKGKLIVPQEYINYKAIGVRNKIKII